AMSKETLRRITVEKGYTTVCRRSIIDDPAYRRTMTFNGQDVAELYLKVLNLGGKSGYMKYRTVPVFPQVGDKINKAIERIATQPQTAWDFSQPARNYHLLLADARLRGSLWVQLQLSLWTVGLQMLLGFGFALLLNLRSRFLEALRTVFLIPMVLPPIVVAIIW